MTRARPTKIGCVCVTEGRASVFGIAVASFVTQQGGAFATLTVDVSDSARGPYEDVLVRHDLADRMLLHDRTAPAPVSDRIHEAVQRLFTQGFDLVTIWDDDDWSPPTRLRETLEKAAELDPTQPICGSYERGYFVNLRTLRGHEIVCDTWPFWGACLTFNRAAFESADGFRGRSVPGYDRDFVGALIGKAPTTAQFFCLKEGLPIAFSHGRNVATSLREHGTDMTMHLQRWLPLAVWLEVQRAREFLISRRIFPDQP